jgi:ATP-dependent Clp protease ATP-binding subunit ClpX
MHVNRLIAGPRGVFICDECVKMCQTILDGERRLSNERAMPVAGNGARSTLSPRAIYKHLDDYVIGQDAAKRNLSVAVYNHYKRIDNKSRLADVEVGKSNVLLVGPTGCGKTYLAQTLAKLLDVPFCIADATALTEAGYVGEDVETILARLIQAADNDIPRAQRGIVYIDEIDKIGRKSGANPSITRDVSGEGVQQALLKIIEGNIVYVPPHGGRKHPQSEMLQIDTTDVLFICGGAFEGLNDIVGERLGTRRHMGIPGQAAKAARTAKATPGNTQASSAQVLSSHISPDDLMRFGLIPELVGRLPVTVALEPLDQRALVDVLVRPKNAIVKQYQRLLSLDGVDLVFNDDALQAAADLAMKQQTGARGLRSIIERTLMNVMYEVPSRRDIRKVVVDAAAVRGEGAPKMYDYTGRLLGAELDQAA